MQFLLGFTQLETFGSPCLTV